MQHLIKICNIYVDTTNMLWYYHSKQICLHYPAGDTEKGKEKMKKYELIPTNGRKSFYGKAIVKVDENKNEILYSYGTPIIKKTATGELVKLWDGWTATTGRHIAAFCGLNKVEYMKL